MSKETNIDHIADYYISRAYQEGYNEAYSRVLERIHSELEHFCVFLALRYPAPENAPKNCMMRGDENVKAWISYMEKCQERGYYDAPAAVTNADRIRSMTDEELAEFFPTTASEFSCPPGSTNESCRNAGGWFNGCPKCWLDWLRQEVNDGKEEKEENQPAK